MSNITFGPIPSRRIGRSLGVNNIPPKYCSYSCVYCQVGRTINLGTKRKYFYDPDKIFEEVKKRVNEVLIAGEKINYISFVPDGEPTLDVNLGKEIKLVKSLGIPVAVFTNSSLLFLEEVREELEEADLVSIKVDAVTERVWRFVNRPSVELKLKDILEGIRKFTEDFSGKIITETMVIKNISYENEFKEISRFLKSLKNIEKFYISIPTRPPAEAWVRPADEETLNFAYQDFSNELGEDKVELLIGYESSNFTVIRNIEDELLSITSVHPLREDIMKEILIKKNKNWDIVQKLLDEGKLKKVEYEGKIFYVRRIA